MNQYTNNEEINHRIDSFFNDSRARSCAYEKGIVTIILIGSLARGEGTWKILGEKSTLVSDVEFWIVHNGSIDFGSIRKKMQELSSLYSSKFASHTFHVDFDFIHEKKISHMEKKLIVYEAKESGKIIYGINCIKQLPNISVKNINLIDIKDILIHRLFSVLYYGNKITDKDSDEYSYLLSKNILDFMTVIAVQNGVLASGFAQRFRILKENHFCDDLIPLFEHCMNIKFNDSKYSRHQYNNAFLYDELFNIAQILNKSFKYNPRNLLINLFYVIRRLFGILKRQIVYKHFFHCNYFKRLLSYKEKCLNRDILLDNLVRNGFPSISDINQIYPIKE